VTGQGVIVLGMHRSGTSALAGLLAELGVFMGARLFDAQEGVNDKGFYENERVVRLNDRVLDRLGARWDQPNLFQPGDSDLSGTQDLASERDTLLSTEYSDRPLWGMKDPRLCLLASFWLEGLARLNHRIHYLVMVREPGQVVSSLSKRDGFCEEKSLMLWLNYTYHSLRWSRRGSSTVITFSELLADPGAVSSCIREALGIESSPENAPSFIEQKLNRSANHSLGSFPVARLASGVYEELSATDPDYERVDELLNEYLSLQEALSPALLEHISLLAREERHYRRLFWGAYDSVWWRLAYPLKRLEQWVRGR
jgi:hypothetical protein